jgi:hypothetical protein
MSDADFAKLMNKCYPQITKSLNAAEKAIDAIAEYIKYLEKKQHG